VEYLKLLDEDIIVCNWIENGKIMKSQRGRRIKDNITLFTPTVTYKTSMITKMPVPNVITSFLEDK
jgi:hypothetical protein